MKNVKVESHGNSFVGNLDAKMYKQMLDYSNKVVLHVVEFITDHNGPFETMETPHSAYYAYNKNESESWPTQVTVGASFAYIDVKTELKEKFAEAIRKLGYFPNQLMICDCTFYFIEGFDETKNEDI